MKNGFSNCAFKPLVVHLSRMEEYRCYVLPCFHVVYRCFVLQVQLKWMLIRTSQYGYQFYINYSTIYHTCELVLNLDHKVCYTAIGHGTPKTAMSVRVFPL